MSVVGESLPEPHAVVDDAGAGEVLKKGPPLLESAARRGEAANAQALRRQQLQGRLSVKPRAVPPEGALVAEGSVSTGASRRRRFQLAGGPQIGQELPSVEPKLPPPGPFSETPDTGLNGWLFGMPIPADASKPPRGAGGKGGLMQPDDRKRADDALATMPNADAAHPFHVSNAALERQLGQLGIDPTAGDQRLVVHDVDARHGDEVTRAAAGAPGLVDPKDVFLDAPDDTDAYIEGQKAHAEFVRQRAGTDPSVSDLVSAETRGFSDAVDEMGLTVSRLAMERNSEGVEGNVYLNMSYGVTPDAAANRIAARMATAPRGSALYARATEVLGHAPTRTEVGEGRFQLDADEIAKLKEKAVYPEMRTRMATPEYKEAMTAARGRLEGALKFGRENGVMAFESAMNDYASAEAAGDPMMSRIVTSGVPGLFTVGATDPKQPGVGDDTMAPFSGDGHVVASQAGMNIPVGVGPNGKAQGRNGTSYAAPLMTRTAYLVGAANPELDPDGIESVLTDPRVARDLSPGARRDGVGVVDDLAAVLVARDPSITADQIEAIRRQLDANPTRQFTLRDGGVTPTSP